MNKKQYIPKKEHWDYNIWTGERLEPNLETRDNEVLLTDINELYDLIEINGAKIHAAWDHARLAIGEWNDPNRKVYRFDYRWINQLWEEGLLYQTFVGKAGRAYRKRVKDDLEQKSQVWNGFSIFEGKCTNPDCPKCNGGNGVSCR